MPRVVKQALCSLWRAHSGAEGNCKEGGASERNSCVIIDQQPVLLLTSLKGLSTTCSDREGKREGSGVKEWNWARKR